MKIFIFLFFLTYPSNKDLIYSSDIVYKDVAVAIYLHETASGKKLRNNNLFGWKYKFNSKSSSIHAYEAYEKKIISKYNIRSSSSYLHIISKTYASDKKWNVKVKKHLKQIK